MTLLELENLIDHVQTLKAETQTLELKAAAQGCPTRLKLIRTGSHSDLF